MTNRIIFVVHNAKARSPLWMIAYYTIAPVAVKRTRFCKVIITALTADKL